MIDNIIAAANSINMHFSTEKLSAYIVRKNVLMLNNNNEFIKASNNPLKIERFFIMFYLCYSNSAPSGMGVVLIQFVLNIRPISLTLFS